VRPGAPRGHAPILRRHPLLAADLLALHRRWVRLRAAPRILAAVVLAALLGITLLLLAMRRLDPWLASGFTWAMTHEVWVGVLVALHAALHVGRRRSLIEQPHALSWLVAAAPAPGMPLLARLWRTLWPMGLQLTAAIAFALLLGWRHGRSAAAGLLTVWLFAGAAMGSVVGWWCGRRQDTAWARPEDSRYVPRARGRNPEHRPTLVPLSHLSVARARAWYRPENLRLFVLLVIATLPAGTAPQSALCAVCVAFLASYASSLARAVMHTASEAASWLQATPIRFLAFAWPIMRRAAVHQVLLSAAAAALLLPLGATLVQVTYLVLLWLTLVSMSWCLWLQGCFQGQRPWLKVVSSVATALGVEQLARGAGLAGAVLWTCWNLRRSPV
jgi:hypothetical protein